MRLIGSYEQGMDDKNRMRIPAKLRQELGDGKPVITVGSNRCLYIFPSSKIQKILDLVENNPPADEDEQAELRVFIANMRDIEEDAQGRFTLPAGYRSYANITKEIICNGMIDKIEVWSKANKSASGLLVDDNFQLPSFKKLAKYGIM